MPTVPLADWALTCRLFNSDVVLGPVPTLFSDRPEVAKTALDKDPEEACQDLARILKKFAKHKNISPSEAWSFVLKPR